VTRLPNAGLPVCLSGSTVSHPASTLFLLSRYNYNAETYVAEIWVRRNNIIVLSVLSYSVVKAA
jgi:hypothetical protein